MTTRLRTPAVQDTLNAFEALYRVLPIDDAEERTAAAHADVAWMKAQGWSQQEIADTLHGSLMSVIEEFG